MAWREKIICALWYENITRKGVIMAVCGSGNATVSRAIYKLLLDWEVEEIELGNQNNRELRLSDQLRKTYDLEDFCR